MCPDDLAILTPSVKDLQVFQRQGKTAVKTGLEFNEQQGCKFSRMQTRRIR